MYRLMQIMGKEKETSERIGNHANEFPTFGFLADLLNNKTKNGEPRWKGKIKLNGAELTAELSTEWDRNKFRNPFHIKLSNEHQKETWTLIEFSDELALFLSSSESNTLLCPTSKIDRFGNSLGFKDASIVYKKMKGHPERIFLNDIDLEKSKVDNHVRFNNINEVIASLTKLTIAIQTSAVKK